MVLLYNEVGQVCPNKKTPKLLKQQTSLYALVASSATGLQQFVTRWTLLLINLSLNKDLVCNLISESLSAGINASLQFKIEISPSPD